MELATAGAAKVLGPDHGVIKALAKAAITMDKADLWQADACQERLDALNDQEPQ